MTAKKNLRFSVVIPCYNEEKYIAKTLKSLKKQDFKGGFEVIVVDNNSNDRSPSIAKKYSAKVIHESKPGVCYARQAGSEKAQGEILISTDADTTFPTNWLSSIDEKFSKNAEAVAVCAPCQFINAPWWGRSYTKVLFGLVNFIFKITGRVFYITATNTAFKKSAWQGYNTDLPQGGDELDLLRKLRKKGKVIFSQDYTVYTSSRRLEHGMWYNIIVTFGYYYFTAYFANRIFKRELIGSYPAYRENTLFRIPKDLTKKAHKYREKITNVK